MALSGSFTSSWQQRVLDALANNNIVDAALDGLKVGLFTADPGEAGSISNEISGNGYARQALTFGAATNNASNHAEVANTNALAFAASGGAWSGITHAGVFRTKSLTRSIVGVTNANETDQSNNAVSYTKLIIPSSHCSTVATLTITGFDVVDRDGSDSATDVHSVLTYSGSNATYYTQETNGGSNATNFIRIKTGPLAGICYDLIGEGTNTLTLDSYYKFTNEDILNQKVEVMAKVTLAELSGIVHNSSTTYDSNGYAASGSGFFGGSTSTGDRIYIHGADQTVHYYYAQIAPTFAGDNGWRKAGISAAADAGGVVIPPAELWPHTDQTSDDYCMLDTRQTADWTLTSQVSTTDEMVARFQFEDGSGNAQTHNVADGDQLNISAGDLKLSLN